MLADRKTIGSKGRLTASVINQLTKYYNKAIRNNSDSVADMQKNIWDTFYHKRSSDAEPQHHVRPEGAKSWCKWQRSTPTERRNFVHQNNISAAVMDTMKPIYEDLTNEDLLSRCIGAHIQNSNACLNALIWKIVPKKEFSGLEVLKIGVYSAVSLFNDGAEAWLKIMRYFNISPGLSAHNLAQESNQSRFYHAQRRIDKEARTFRLSARHNTGDDSCGAGSY